MTTVAKRLTPNHAYQVSGGAQRRTVNNVTMDSSYLEGGEPITAAQLGLNRVEYATCTIASTSGAAANVASASYDPATSLLHVWDNTPAEVAGAGNIATTVVQVIAYGQ